MTTPTAGPRPRLVATGPGELLAVVPYRLGFHPRQSLVLLALDPPAPGGSRRRVGAVVRCDLPTRVEDAQELVDTQAAPYGPDLVATLPDDTTYSVHGDHGGIRRAAQQIPIVFAGAGLSGKDVKAPVRSVDIMPTILKAMGIAPTYPMDDRAWSLPTRKRR